MANVPIIQMGALQDGTDRTGWTKKKHTAAEQRTARQTQERRREGDEEKAEPGSCSWKKRGKRETREKVKGRCMYGHGEGA